jgi:formate hydrogenlyase subunit 3/multisubunit Na+/H+ antiporter MnhD subunit
MADDEIKVNGESQENAPVYEAEVVGSEKKDKASGLAITALVLSILSFCCCGIFAGIPAVIVGWIEYNNIKAGKSSEKGKWMALVGIILGLFSILWSCLWTAWYFFWGGSAIMNSFIRPF